MTSVQLRDPCSFPSSLNYITLWYKAVSDSVSEVWQVFSHSIIVKVPTVQEDRLRGNSDERAHDRTILSYWKCVILWKLKCHLLFAIQYQWYYQKDTKKSSRNVSLMKWKSKFTSSLIDGVRRVHRCPEIYIYNKNNISGDKVVIWLCWLTGSHTRWSSSL